MLMHPTEYQCLEDGALLFSVRAFDADCSEVSIKCAVTPEEWPEISKRVLHALEQIHGEGL